MNIAVLEDAGLSFRQLIFFCLLKLGVFGIAPIVGALPFGQVPKDALRADDLARCRRPRADLGIQANWNRRRTPIL